MDEVLVRTAIEVPPGEAFAFLRDFPGYADYSEHLRRVERRGDSGAGTVYEVEAVWWKLAYTARTEVTAIEEPSRIEWRVLDPLDAAGAWEIDPFERGGEPASRVTLRIRYDASSADAGVVGLPRFVSVGWVVDRVRPIVTREAEATVERIVADLEGEPRPVDLEIETRQS